jgi:tetratricopeptide (TPR) repeat protein
LASDRFEDAIRLFSLNVELFPQSANAYDSLGEAYMRNGQRALAIENYQRSLALDPGNANAERMLAQLR